MRGALIATHLGFLGSGLRTVLGSKIFFATLWTKVMYAAVGCRALRGVRGGICPLRAKINYELFWVFYTILRKA